MANPYTQQSIAGYNATPPPDDGSQSESNRLEWSKHIEKIGDPLKTLAAAIDQAVYDAFDSLTITDDIAVENAIIGYDTFSNRKAFNELMFAGIRRRLTNAEADIEVANVTEDTVVSQAVLSRDMMIEMRTRQLQREINRAREFALNSEDAIVADAMWS
jgi:hypothetical protein